MARADRFTGKRVVVLGGNSGIGLACAQGFAEEGAGVRLTGRDPQTIASAVASIPGAKGNSVDISDLAAMDAFYETIAAEEGGIDVLMVNAGMGGFSLIEDMTSEYWDQVHAINLRGCVFAMQKAVRLMGEGGAIVVTGSIGGPMPSCPATRPMARPRQALRSPCASSRASMSRAGSGSTW